MRKLQPIIQYCHPERGLLTAGLAEMLERRVEALMLTAMTHVEIELGEGETSALLELPGLIRLIEIDEKKDSREIVWSWVDSDIKSLLLIRQDGEQPWTEITVRGMDGRTAYLGYDSLEPAGSDACQPAEIRTQGTLNPEEQAAIVNQALGVSLFIP